jgi:lysophospholipase-2
MAPYVTHRENGVITVSPKIESEQSGLVVISHGLGDSAEGFVDVAEHLASQMPHLKFILPTAPTQPVTMNMGMPMPSWYDITGLDERSNENCKGIDQSQKTLTDILKKEHETMGLNYNRMILAGFSQGGALSLFTGMQLECGKIGGVVVMSGYLPAAKKFTIREENKDIPILHCHGEADPMVTIQMAHKSKETVMEKGALKYELKTYPGLVHSVNPEEIQHVKEFLEGVLPSDKECQVKLKDPSEMSVKELRAAIRKAGLGSKAVGLMEKSEFIKLVRDHRDGKL